MANFSGSLVDDPNPMGGNIQAVPHVGIQGPRGPQGPEGGHYIPHIEQTGDNELTFEFSPSSPDMPAVDPVHVVLPAAPDSGGNVDLTGSATPGQMIIVKTIDENGKPVEWEAVDRTHWEESETIFPETILEDGVNGVWNPEGAMDYDAFGFNIPDNLSAGETYIVSIDGVEHTVICEYGEMEFFSLWKNRVFEICQADGYDWGDGCNTVIYLHNLKTDAEGNAVWEPISLSIRTAGNIKKLDSKYLNMDAIKSTFPTIDLTATLEDGTTRTYKLYGEVLV